MFSKILGIALLATYINAQYHEQQGHGSSYISFTQDAGHSGLGLGSLGLGGYGGSSLGGYGSSGGSSSGGHQGSSYISYSQGGHSGSSLGLGGSSSSGGSSSGHGSSYISYSQGGHGGLSGGSSLGSSGGSSGHGSSYISYSQGGAGSSLGGSIGHAIPVIQTESHHEEHHAPAKYQFKYGVQDKHTGDIKQHEETRDGHVVKGSYSLHEPDGTILTVHYTADKKSGFNAVVQRSGHATHPQKSHH
ncbi:hypothetical protein Zmor_012678 [Zophobas morio]|uniref:Uncharacterized protein n=1 Tax=Zophobas morio TaxID=2755281 RepID=A0AA38ICL2_9CUCU|nr:hypothetical protein Zmor_012678 [Zophobas morio]